MNTFLHVLVYFFLALAGGALFFEIQLNDKRTELTERNRMQEEFFVKIARTIEKADPDKSASFEIKKDASPVEARLVDTPDMDNLLDDYQAPLEQTNLDTYNWGENERQQLRNVFVLDAEGKPARDGDRLQTRDSDEEKLLNRLLESAKQQQSRLNTTRAALTELRGKLDQAVAEINKLKPDGRQDKVTIEELKEKIAKLEQEKADLENQIVKLKAQIEELNGEITSLKDEVTTAKDETERANEEIAKLQKVNEKLNELLKKAIQTQANRNQMSSAGGGLLNLPAGDKGKIIEANNEDMFAIVELSADTIRDLKGEDMKNPIPMIELGIRRPGFQGEAGEFVGRIRFRQEVKGKPYVICDILGDWEQTKAQAGDLIFAD